MTAHPANAPDIVAIVDSFPPLTAEDCERLAPLWRPGVLAVQKVTREREAAARQAARRKRRIR
jgi:hypothetical protein